jgi:hypothetical protein
MPATGTGRTSYPQIVLDFGTLTQLTTSNSNYNTVASIAVHPFSTIRFDRSSTAGWVDIQLKGSIDGGSAYDDTISSLIDQSSSEAVSTKSVTDSVYTHIQVLAKISTAATTSAGNTAQIKWIGK